MGGPGITHEELHAFARSLGLTPKDAPPMPEPLLPLDAPLNGLGKALFGGVLALGQAMGATVPDISRDAVITGAQAIAIGQDVLGDIFPAMRS